jgi:IS605 OrfB family transposase
MILSRKFKLLVSTEQNDILLDTLEQYKQAINLPLEYGFNNKQVSGSELHKATYYTLRNKTKLPSQLICSSRCKATEMLKSIKTKTKGKFNTKQPQSHKYPSIRFDRNSCSITGTSIKISTTNKRIEIPLVSYSFTNNIQWKDVQKTCELMYKASSKEWYLVVFVETQEPSIKESKDILGIDRGCKHIAVCSNNIFFGSKQCNKNIRKYNYLRKHLQSKGTKSAKKLLKKLSGQEHRFRQDVNHCISKKIVAFPFDTFVFEKLHIKRKREQGRRFNSILNNWSYYQLEQFVKYKAALVGKRVEYVDARYTSQKCSACGYIERSNRKTQSSFQCKQCDFKLNADLNASRNIKQNFNTVLGTSLNSRVQSITHTNLGCSTKVQAPLL